MHTEKQVKDIPSRMFRQPEGKGTQQFRLRDNRVSKGKQSDIMQKCGIFISPASRSTTDNETKNLAIEQTLAARKLLHHPDQYVSEQLSLAAKKLQFIFKELQKVGLQYAPSARLLGREGIMRQKPIDDVFKALDRVNTKKDASSVDRAMVIELMGGIGALFANTGATTGMEGRTASAEIQLRTELMRLIPKMNSQRIDAMKELGDSAVVGPRKKAERKRLSENRVPRSGIHNVGGLINTEVNPLDIDKWPLISWQEASISKSKVDHTVEPLVGHMSGSPSEALAIWDALLDCKEPYVEASNITLVNMSNGVQPAISTSFHNETELNKSARLAAATAYLISAGFHSSVEVLESALKYTGQNPRLTDFYSKIQDDAADIFGNGAATSLIKELHESHTLSASDNQSSLKTPFFSFDKGNKDIRPPAVKSILATRLKGQKPQIVIPVPAKKGKNVRPFRYVI